MIPTLQLFLYRGDTGAEIGQIPFIEEAFEDELNGPGSGMVTVAAENAANLAYNDGGVVALGDRPDVVKAWVDGVPRYAWVIDGSSWEWPEDTGEAEGQALAPVVKLVGSGAAVSWLDDARVPMPSGGATEHQSVGEARAKIIKREITAAKVRGCFPQLTVGWSDTQDSAGVAWTDADTMRLSGGASLLQLTDDWSQYGFDYHGEVDGELNAWKVKGEDLTGEVRWFPGRHFRPRQEARDFKSIRNYITGSAQDGSTTTSTDATSVARYRRREDFQSIGGYPYDTAPAVTAMLAETKNPATERSLKLLPGEEGARPYVDFNLGDTVAVWMDAPTPGFRSMRVMAIAVKEDPDGVVDVEVTLDTVLARRYKRWIKDVENTPAPSDPIDPAPPVQPYEPVLTQADIVFDFAMAGWPDTPAPPPGTVEAPPPVYVAEPGGSAAVPPGGTFSAGGDPADPEGAGIRVDDKGNLHIRPPGNLHIHDEAAIRILASDVEVGVLGYDADAGPYLLFHDDGEPRLQLVSTNTEGLPEILLRDLSLYRAVLNPRTLALLDSAGENVFAFMDITEDAGDYEGMVRVSRTDGQQATLVPYNLTIYNDALIGTVYSEGADWQNADSGRYLQVSTGWHAFFAYSPEFFASLALDEGGSFIRAKWAGGTYASPGDHAEIQVWPGSGSEVELISATSSRFKAYAGTISSITAALTAVAEGNNAYLSFSECPSAPSLLDTGIVYVRANKLYFRNSGGEHLVAG